jgi:apolipoprotein N-acyltransferase
MTLRHLFTTTSIISAVYGFGLMFAPRAMSAFFSQHLELGGYANTRMWGAAIIGFAVLTWLCRDAEDSQVRRGIVLALFCYFIIALATCLLNFWTEPQPLIAWTTPLVYLLLAVAYGYFHFFHRVQQNDSISLIGLPR